MVQQYHRHDKETVDSERWFDTGGDIRGAVSCGRESVYGLLMYEPAGASCRGFPPFVDVSATAMLLLLPPSY